MKNSRRNRANERAAKEAARNVAKVSRYALKNRIGAESFKASLRGYGLYDKYIEEGGVIPKTFQPPSAPATLDLETARANLERHYKTLPTCPVCKQPILPITGACGCPGEDQ